MGYSAVKTQVNTRLQTVAGVTRVFIDAANVAPINADCPAIIITDGDPWMTVKALYSGTLRESYHLDFLFLWKPQGLATEEEFRNSVEGFPALIVQAMWGALTLSGNAVDQDLRADITPGKVMYGTETYWGFVVPWTVHADIAFNVAA